MKPITYPEIKLQLKAKGVNLDTVPAAELVDEVAEILFAAKGVDLDTTTKSVPPFPYLDRETQLWSTSEYVAAALLEEGE
jgi:hypothetical protein